jgi:hypothetical protein
VIQNQKEKAPFKSKPTRLRSSGMREVGVFAAQLFCNYPPARLAICGLNLATAQSQPVSYDRSKVLPRLGRFFL